MSDSINLTNKSFWTHSLLMFFIGVMLGMWFLIGIGWGPATETQDSNLQWGGNPPMKIYTVFDRDTGVYYAVTEKGGICVMQTMTGETKLVDEGEPPVIHHNQGVD